MPEVKVKSLGEKLLPVLSEIEETLWESEANYPNTPHNFPKEGLKAGAKIFMAVMIDWLWKYSKENNYPQKEREDRAVALGIRIRQLVFEFTGQNTQEFYKR